MLRGTMEVDVNGYEVGDECSVTRGITPGGGVKRLSKLLLKASTEGAGGLCQYLTALTEKTDPLLREWLRP